jgi:hypothetical protein
MHCLYSIILFYVIQGLKLLKFKFEGYFILLVKLQVDWWQCSIAICVIYGIYARVIIDARTFDWLIVYLMVPNYSRNPA